MNDNLHNGDVSSEISLINIHTLSQFNESSNLNDMNWDVEDGDVSGGHSYMKIHTLSEANNHNYIYSTKKRYENDPILSEMENIRLQDGVEIGFMLPASTLH